MASMISFLCLATMGGLSGFERGGLAAGICGIAAVLVSGAAIAWSLLCRRRLTSLGLNANL